MEPYRVELRRVGIALLASFGLRAAGVLVGFVTGASHSFTLDVMSLILGVLLLQGSLGAARWAAFFTASGLAATLASVVLGVPVALTIGRDLWGPFTVWSLALWVSVALALYVVFALWVLRELRSPTVEEALVAARKGSIRRAQWWGTGVGAGCVVLILAVMIPVMRTWSNIKVPAVAAAHQQLGADWDVQITRYSSGSNGWKAHVIARRGNEVKELDVSGD